MEYITKLLLSIITAILLISAIYIIFFTGEVDNEAPEYNFITGDISGIAGEIKTIYVEFTDNIEVTNASLYYQIENNNQWNILSVLNGSTNISLPSNSDNNIYYYVEINDAAGNGPVRSPLDNDTFYIISVTKEDDNNHNDEHSSHVVFIEEGTTTWCSNCGGVSDVIHDYFDPDDPDFYYVSLIHDKTEIAEDRLDTDYNLYAFPSVYIDGGYEVIVGPNNFESKFQESIENANNRDVPNIYLNLTSEWNETRREVKNTVNIRNNDDSIYNGRLKIYITEITSSWRDYDNERFSYTLIDYGYNENIELDINESKTISETWTASDNIDKDNLWIIAVVFNSDPKQANSDPDDNSNPFNAYYADAAHGVKVTEEIGNAPPSIVITTPQEFHHYILGGDKKNSRLLATYIIGKLTIEVDIEAEAGIDRVEYKINGPLREFTETLTESPYSYEWDRFSFGKYTIAVTLYDEDGNTSTDDIEVYIFNI